MKDKLDYAPQAPMDKTDKLVYWRDWDLFVQNNSDYKADIKNGVMSVSIVKGLEKYFNYDNTEN